MEVGRLWCYAYSVCDGLAEDLVMSTSALLRIYLCGFLFGLVALSEARAQWVADGIAVCTDPGVQLRTGIVSNELGGAIVFWVDYRDLVADLYAQGVNADGTIAPGWPQNGVKFGVDHGDLSSPVGIPDGFGGAIVVWEQLPQGATSHNIFAQRIKPNGAVALGWPADGFPVCTALGDQRAPRLVSDGQGGAIIAWQDGRGESGPDPSPRIYAQRITSDGNIAPGWPIDGMPTCTTPELQTFPALVVDGVGGAIITWADGRNLDASGADIYAQRITAGGLVAAGWDLDGIAVCTALGHQNSPTAVAAADGGSIIVWRDLRSRPGSVDGSGYDDIYAQRILSDGSVAEGWPGNGAPLCRAPRTQQFLSAASDGLGGAIVAWEDYRRNSFPISAASDIYAQRITAEGAIPQGWPADGVALCSEAGFQLNPTLAPDGAGGAYVTWEDTRSGTNEDVYAQHVMTSGEVAFGWEPNGVPVCTQPASQPAPVVVPDGFGGVITAWADIRKGNKDIFAHKLGVDGPVPALISLVSADATAVEVVLVWYGRDAAALRAVVHRRAVSGEWVSVGFPVDDGGDRLRYVDSSVQPGERYWYRVAYQGSSGDQFSEEVWVDVPLPSLTLSGFRPNPSRGDLLVSFSLPTTEPATLDLLSVTGRILRSRDVSALGTGNHLFNLGDRDGLAPGVYWLRLTQGGRKLVTKGVISN